MPEPSKEIITEATDEAKKSALGTVAIFPAIMFVSYLLLIAYFRSKGGYKALALDAAVTPRD